MWGQISLISIAINSIAEYIKTQNNPSGGAGNGDMHPPRALDDAEAVDPVEEKESKETREQFIVDDYVVHKTRRPDDEDDSDGQTGGHGHARGVVDNPGPQKAASSGKTQSGASGEGGQKESTKTPKDTLDTAILSINERIVKNRMVVERRRAEFFKRLRAEEAGVQAAVGLHTRPTVPKQPSPWPQGRTVLSEVYMCP